MRKIHLFMDGNQIAATWDSFDCLAVSPAGFGDTVGESVTDLIKNTQAYELNGIVSSIENAPPNTAESPAIPQQLKAEILRYADEGIELCFGSGCDERIATRFEKIIAKLSAV